MITETTPQFLQDKDLDEAQMKIGALTPCILGAIAKQKAGNATADRVFVNKLQDMLLEQVKRLEGLK